MLNINIIMQKFRCATTVLLWMFFAALILFSANVTVSADPLPIFEEESTTLSSMYDKASSYMLSPINHELTKLPSDGTVPGGAILVSINNETYYYVPSSTEDKTFLKILSTYGNLALKTTTNQAKAVYSYDGVYYTYDSAKFISSAFTLTPTETRGVNTITKYELNSATGEYESQNYEISLNPAGINSERVKYTVVPPETAGAVVVELAEGNKQGLEYTYTKPSTWSETSSVKVDNIVDEPDGYISEASGGALHTTPDSSVIVENFIFNGCAADVTNSYAGSDSPQYYAYGGAIYNEKGGTLSLTADFIGNYVKVTKNTTAGSGFNLYGGAIANFGTINSITGDFVKNYTYGQDTYVSGGGAIYNEDASIGRISGNFVANYAYTGNQPTRGGAIYNNVSQNGRAVIGDIDANFIGNYITGSSVYGGAIAQNTKNVNSNISIGNIQGSFVGNYASAHSGGREAFGGAIYNRAGYANTTLKIGDITGDFIGNYVSAPSYANGGAIYNYSGGNGGNVSIGNIVGDFISNSTYVLAENNTQSPTSYGGAIYNGKEQTGRGSANMGYLSGMFMNNHVYARSTYSADARGGAIYNTSQIGDENGSIINSSFVNNYAVAFKGPQLGAVATARGGAIYTTKDLTIVADDYTSTFSGNYVKTGERTTSGEETIIDVSPEAIYVDSNSAKLTFKAQNNGKFMIDDQINGTDGYSLEFVGDDTGVADMNAFIKGSPTLKVDTATLNYNTANNGTMDTTSLNSVNVTNGGKFKTMIDFDIENRLSDNFSVSENSSGVIDISKVNLILPSEQLTNSNSFVLQILQTRNNNLQLALTDESVLTEFLISHISGSKEEDEPVETVTDWTHTYYHHVYSNADIYGVMSLDKTDTINDSIKVTTRLVGEDTKTSRGDTLNLVNKADLEERTFSTEDKTATYNLSENLGEASAGTFNITGAKDDEHISTVNLNNKTGFNLTNETRLNLKDVKLTGNDTLVTVSNENASVGVDGAVIDGNITTTNENGYDLDITGNSKFNGTVGKANATLTDGTLKMNTNTFAEANLTANSGTIDLSNNASEDYNIGTLASDENVTYIIDFDVMQKTADTIRTTNASSGPVVIDGINFVDGKTFANLPEDMRSDLPYVVRILYTQNDDLYLELSDTAKAIIGDNEYIIGQDTIDVSDVVQAETPWIESFYNNYTQDITQYGDIEIRSYEEGGTARDSIGISYSKTEYGEKTYVGSQGDTLKVVNQADLPERSFVTDDSAVSYTVTDDLGETSEGTMNVVGGVKVIPADPDDPTSYEMTQRSTLNYNGHNGFVLSNDNTTLNFKNVKLTGAQNIATSNNETSVISFDNVEIVDNDFGVQTAGGVDISGKSSIGSPIELTSGNSVMNIDGTNDVDIDSELSGVQGSKLNVRNGNLNLKDNAKITSLDTTLQDTTVNVSNEAVMDGNNLTVQNSATINMNNGAIGTMNFADMLLNGDLNITADVDLSKRKMDMLLADSFDPDSTGMINVKKLTLLTPTKSKKVQIPFTNQTLASHVKYTGEGKVAYSPVYKYTTSYNNQDGYFTFARGSSGHHTSYNPSVLASQVSALAGIYGTQLQTFDYGFQHSSIYMDMPIKQRLAEKNENKYAFDSISAAGMYSPLMTRNDKSGFWVKPYAVFEKVDLKHGPKVSNMNYGTMFGFDTSLQRIRGGFDRVFTYYIGYSGSMQSYDHVDIFQNGGLIGFTTSLYKGNFFNATTVSVGATIGDASTKFGSDTFVSMYGGVANKVGYNLEFKDGRFIIQPSFVLGYSFIDTFKYKTKSGANIKSDPFNIIHIAPGIKFIANTKNGWQPYIGLQLVWDILVNSKVTADGIRLPSMDFEPYFQYGLGVQKLYADRFMFFGQAMVRNGGRNGVAISAGMRWILGE